MTHRLFQILWLQSVLFVSILTLNKLNDDCQVARSGSLGKCKFIESCPKVLQEIREQGLFPNFCGHENNKELICCPVPPTPKPIIASPVPNRISVKKCAEYQDPLYERSWITVGVNQMPFEQKVFRCPIASIPFIVGGVDAEPKEFPHMASIGYDDSTRKENITWACGGTLISEKFVLTAGHCINTRLGAAKHVMLGELNRAAKDENAQPRQFQIVDMIKHPAYKAPHKYNDIALIRLNESVTFNQYIRPACLPEIPAAESGRAIACGWGKIDFNQPVSDTLRKTGLELFTNVECNTLYKSQSNRYISRGILNDTQLCAGSHNGRNDTCQGDSGGPLQVFHNRLSCMYSVIGVTSFGVSCGIGIPGIYTRVFAYLDWIETIVWPNELV